MEYGTIAGSCKSLLKYLHSDSWFVPSLSLLIFGCGGLVCELLDVNSPER